MRGREREREFKNDSYFEATRTATINTIPFIQREKRQQVETRCNSRIVIE